MLVTNYGAKNVLVRGGQKVGDIMIRFVMRASNNVCVFHSIYFWSVSGSIWSGRAGEAACWCWWPVTGRWKSLCCVVFHLLHLLSSISRAGCLCADVGPRLGPAQIWTIISRRGAVSRAACRHIAGEDYRAAHQLQTIVTSVSSNGAQYSGRREGPTKCVRIQ